MAEIVVGTAESGVGFASEPPDAPSPNGTGSDASTAIGPTADLADAMAPSPPDVVTRGWLRPSETPTQEGPGGVRFDFNSGARVLLPKGGAPWKVRISDLDTGNILYQTKIEGGRVNSSKHIPHGSKDMTGLSLKDCARWLKHAHVFIGLSSGLSWRAWGGWRPGRDGQRLLASDDRVRHAVPGDQLSTCNSCWNDPTLRFDHKDFLWCPRHKNMPRQFECTRLITVEQVKAAIRRIPTFRE
jgi:hypothetical protein